MTTPCPTSWKHRHATWQAAMKARDSLEAARGIDIALRPYRCGDHWHLGHKNRGSLRTQLKRALRSGAARRPRRRT